MKSGPRLESFVHLAVLRLAALLVPRSQRLEWFAEWRAELWYVDRGRSGFCLGAFRDAFWFRGNTPATVRSFGLESPVRCIVLLAILAGASIFFAFRLPFPRDILLPSPYRDAGNLAMISANGRYNVEVPTIPIDQYLAMERLGPYQFTGVAFYTAVRQSKDLSIAVVSANLFELLQIPIAAPKGSSRLLLSDAAWRKYFDGDPRIVGRVVQVGGQSAVVAGLIPANSWRLPGRVDAWLLQDQAHLAALAPGTTGFVVGRVKTQPSGAAPPPRWRFSVPNQQGLYDFYECSSLAQGDFIAGYLLMFAISVLVISATTPLGLGEYSVNRHAPSGTMRMRRWIFLSLKVALLLPFVCCGTLDLIPLISKGFQAHGLLVGTILGLRWAIIDQRRRCPVCLRLLGSPARIGQPSQTFLEWYGTESICREGHGFLYVPELPTISFNSQRWLYLDPSWQGLFRRSG